MLWGSLSGLALGLTGGGGSILVYNLNNSIRVWRFLPCTQIISKVVSWSERWVSIIVTFVPGLTIYSFGGDGRKHIMKKTQFNRDQKDPDIEINRPQHPQKLWQNPNFTLLMYIVFLWASIYFWQGIKSAQQIEMP